MKKNIVVALTGASGAIYGVRLVEVLQAAGHDVHLSISPAAKIVLKQELDLNIDLDDFKLETLMLGGLDAPGDSRITRLRDASGVASSDSNVLSFSRGEPGRVTYHHYGDIAASIASGSFQTDGMVICPCSGGTLAAIVSSLANNLIHRAAAVHLKEHRKLIVVPRETPLSTLQLECMHKASAAGVVVLPASPGFYHGVTKIQDLVDFVVARICDQLGFEHSLIQRWSGV